jgi:hypothetical protein
MTLWMGTSPSPFARGLGARISRGWAELVALSQGVGAGVFRHGISEAGATTPIGFMRLRFGGEEIVRGLGHVFGVPKAVARVEILAHGGCTLGEGVEGQAVFEEPKFPSVPGVPHFSHLCAHITPRHCPRHDGGRQCPGEGEGVGQCTRTTCAGSGEGV